MEQGNVLQDKLTTEPPNITTGNFEDYLVADDLLVDYFNVFLSLLRFPKQIWYNKERHIFEIVDNAKKSLLKQLKGLVQAYMPIDPIYKSKQQYPKFEQNMTAQHWEFDDKFTVECLDREQGVRFILNERLPAFLKSDCYFEYRLAKLLSQLDCSTGPGMPQIGQSYLSWHFEVEETPAPKIVDEAEDIMKKLYICLGEIKYQVNRNPNYLDWSDNEMPDKASVTQAKSLFTEANEETTMKLVQSDRKPTLTIQTSLHRSSASFKSIERNLSSISLLEDLMVDVEAGKLPVRSQDGRRYSKAAKLESDHSKCKREFSRPKVVDNEIFEFVPECPLQIPRTIFFEVKSESGTEHKVKEEEQISTKDEAKTHENKVKSDDTTIVQNSESNQPSISDETKPHVKSTTSITKTETIISKSSQVNVESLLTVKDNEKGQDFADNLIEESTESDSSSEDDIREFCYTKPAHSYNFKNRKGIGKFRKFILGTAGEKYWWLWIDIERLKVIEDGKKRQRYLNIIQNRYLFSNGEYCINAEARARLGLSFISQWTVEKLCQIQKDIAEPLLLYWGPRYCMNQGYSIRQAGIVLKDWEDRQLRPKPNVGLFPKITHVPLFSAKIDCTPKPVKDSVKECKPKEISYLNQMKVMPHGKLFKENCSVIRHDSPVAQGESKEKLLISISSVGSEVSKSFQDLELHRAKEVYNLEKLMRITKFHEAKCSYKMDDLLQALQCESRTGYIFTHFCEQTRNLLWTNAINLWSDLREYQQLFYAEIFQPFKLRRQAQYIFATYVVDGSPLDVELTAENRNSTYKRLEPPFEDLFDQVEEHILILLLVPWMQMIEIDMSRYRKVDLARETRYLDSAYYKKLKEIQKKIWPNEEIILPVRSPSQVQILDEPKSKNYWQNVPEKFLNYTLDSLIRNHIEIENFQAFLRKNFAGLDLNCWLDIEHFRKIPHNEEEDRNNKSKEIKSKYLNRKYFFGPCSPATKAQQNEVMMLAGGWGKLLHEQLSSDVLVEVQRYIKARIERKWLPMFLATPEFAERHHTLVQMQDVVEDQVLQQSRKKQGALKLMDNKLVSTSKEIIAFRKALLNPVTTLQFRQFVSLKGELMENDVIFWLEVQKYKDMCYSKTSEKNIQNKITAIINCFINSNIPPPLQIDIPQEYADRIINDRQKQGIYIFREAQMAVFDILFKLWPDFTSFQQSVAEEGNLQNTERIRKKQGVSEREEIGRSSPEDVGKGYSIHFDASTKSTGSVMSLKGGSDKPTKDQQTIEAGNTQQLCWSFSKYMDTLNREKELIPGT